MRAPVIRHLFFVALVAGVSLGAQAGPQAVLEADQGRVRIEVSGVADVRFIAAGPHTSWLDGGFGRTRYGGSDQDRDGLADETAFLFRASQLSLVVGAHIGDEVSAHLHTNVDADNRGRGLLNTVGIVEGYVAWRRILTPDWRLRVRGGVTIPPFSLEHPGTAWSTKYTITPSAIGSWLGEELKSTGVEATFVRTLPNFTELELQVGVFSGNDSTGALLAWRGWALHDRQGQLNDDLPLPSIPSIQDPELFGAQGLRTRPFRELDGRLGYHVQAHGRFGERGMLQGGWYDNNADRNAFSDGDYAWHTRFFVVGGELQLGPVQLVGQYLDGSTQMGPPDPPPVDAAFRSGYLLASYPRGRHRLSGRFDAFHIDDEDFLFAVDDNRDDGWVATVAYVFELDQHQRFAVELLHVNAEHPFASTTGEQGEFDQSQLQASYRLSF